MAAGGVNPVADDKLLNHNYYAAGVNVEIPLATGGNLDARTKEAQLLKRADDDNVIDVQKHGFSRCPHNLVRLSNRKGTHWRYGRISEGCL